MENEDLTRRVALLEEQVSQLRYDVQHASIAKTEAEAARTEAIAARAEAEMARNRAATASDSAADCRGQLIVHGWKLDAIKEKQGEHGEVLADLQTGMAQIAALLTALAEYTEARQN